MIVVVVPPQRSAEYIFNDGAGKLVEQTCSPLLLVFKPVPALPVTPSEIQTDLEPLLPALHRHFSSLRSPEDARLESKVTVTTIQGGANYAVVHDGPDYVVSECDDGSEGRR